MIKMADVCYEWVLLKIRNSEMFTGLVRVSDDLSKSEGAGGLEDYHRALVADIMQPKMSSVNNSDADRIVVLRNPHQVSIYATPNGRQIATMPLDYGTMAIHIRSQEILFVQVLDESSPIIKEIKAAQSPIKRPNDGAAMTPGGLVLPGQGAPAK